MSASGNMTAYGLARMAELERIDDAICDLYSGQDNKALFKGVTPEARERIRAEMAEIIEALRAWQRKYG